MLSQKKKAGQDYALKLDSLASISTEVMYTVECVVTTYLNTQATRKHSLYPVLMVECRCFKMYYGLPLLWCCKSHQAPMHIDVDFCICGVLSCHIIFYPDNPRSYSQLLFCAACGIVYYFMNSAETQCFRFTWYYKRRANNKHRANSPDVIN